jgi:hypothetical protein
MFDAGKTVALIQGGLLDHRNTWSRWLDEQPGWQLTLWRLAGPLIVLYAVLDPLFSRLMGTGLPTAFRPNLIVEMLQNLVQGTLGFAVITFVTGFLAGKMGGRTDYERAFAAVSIVSVPGVIGSIVGALIPWLGGLIMLAGGIVSLVFLYKIQPLALDVPEPERTKHFIVSLLGIFLINIVIGLTLFSGQSNRGMSGFEAGSAPAGVSGPMSEFERQGRLIEAAESDRYQPPSNGKVSETQVAALISVLQKTERLLEDRTRELDERAKAMEGKENISLRDIGALMGTAGRAVGAMNSEMEVVKTGGGNWAEHQWVKEQLRVARIQQDGSDAIEHNFALFETYREQLGNL